MATATTLTSSLCACGATKSRSYAQCPACYRAARASRPRIRAISERRAEGREWAADQLARFAQEDDRPDRRYDHWSEDNRGLEERESAQEHTGTIESWSMHALSIEARASRERSQRRPGVIARRTRFGVFATRQPPKRVAQREMLEGDRYGVGFDARLRPMQDAESALTRTIDIAFDQMRAGFTSWGEVKLLLARRRELRARLYEAERTLERAAAALDKSSTVEFYIEPEYVEAPDGSLMRPDEDAAFRADILARYGECLYATTFGEAPSEEMLATYFATRSLPSRSR